RVAAPVAAEHHHGVPLPFDDADHRRVGGLVAEERGEHPDGGADREQAHHGAALGEGGAQRVGGPVRADHPHLLRPGRGEPRRGRPAARGDRGDPDAAGAARFAHLPLSSIPAGPVSPGPPGPAVPHSSVTGLAAANRSDPLGSGASREACTWVPPTRYPSAASRSCTVRIRSTEASAATTRPGRNRRTQAAAAASPPPPRKTASGAARPGSESGTRPSRTST